MSEAPRTIKLLSCRECQKKFKTKGGLNLHIRCHRPEEFLLQCNECEFTAWQKGNLEKHIGSIHNKDIEGNYLPHLFPCEHCFLTFNTLSKLQVHVTRKHTTIAEREFQCLYCPYAAVAKADLAKHVRIRHENDRPYACPLCIFKSHTASGMARHERSHMQSKPYQCTLCPMFYADRKRLRDHMLKHSNIKPYSCSNCKYTTNRSDNLKTHFIRNHT